MATNIKEKPKSNAPMLIIGVVLMIAVIGGLWYFQQSRAKTPGSTDTNSNGTPKPQSTQSNTIPPTALPGANPPNSFGSPSAQVVLEEFADFQCPQCGAKHPVFNEIKSMYGSRIYFVFRENPLNIPAHDKSYEAAVAAEAAGMQGKFWDMQNMLFSNQQAWTAAPTYKQIWKDYASKIGLNTDRWESDMAGIAAKGRVDSDLQRSKSIGVNSTPTLYLNGKAFPFEKMTVDGLKAAIDEELQKGSKPAAPATTGGTSTDSK